MNPSPPGERNAMHGYSSNMLDAAPSAPIGRAEDSKLGTRWVQSYQAGCVPGPFVPKETPTDIP